MILKCPQCNAEFTPLSVTQIYCSSKCGNNTEKNIKQYRRQSLLIVLFAVRRLLRKTAQATEEHVFAVRFAKRSIGDTRRLKIRLQEQISIPYRNIRVGREEQMSKMKIEKAIYQLEDLIKDRESFCHHDDFDEVFLQDIEACKMGVPAIISADAHHFSEITLEFAAAEEALKKAGYRSVVNFKEGSWIEVGLS